MLTGLSFKNNQSNEYVTHEFFLQNFYQQKSVNKNSSLFCVLFEKYGLSSTIHKKKNYALQNETLPHIYIEDLQTYTYTINT